jgi:hypothetical protein
MAPLLKLVQAPSPHLVHFLLPLLKVKPSYASWGEKERRVELNKKSANLQKSKMESTAIYLQPVSRKIQTWGITRETTERGGPCRLWNWGKWRLIEYRWRGSFTWLVRWARRESMRDFDPAWLLWSAQSKIFLSSPYTISLYMSLSPSQQGNQSCRDACLLICAWFRA